MPRFLFLILLGSASLLAQALNPGDAFPALEAATLNDGKAKLPDAAAGKTALAVFSFGRDATAHVKAYGDRFVKDFGAAGFFNVAVLDGAPRLLRGMIRGGMKKDVPASLHGQTLLVFADGDLWKKRVKFTSDKHAYLVLLDAKGQVRWMSHGLFEEKKYEELKAAARP
jgi:hypothetical protein